ncbi:HAMP domain-containing sensor histidine kinase [Priestia taiwanensis]|uniref:histidine kinase n=1 Tax=Priestia taiwanensis TaxID=1347902 RepID=A0A917ANR3_9BACI|nr:HAMP domain-containing sensor histidine kinase [Priestia taiwanensis]MBM7362679.1 signal transduction histidine kinase [Priestia taiwanensis]GGE64181.1 two-component sensor histidine kinase [Priestia taiwanensis]
MKRKIVYQFFFLTLALCSFLIAFIFIGQYFIVQYLYIDKEKENIQYNLGKYYETYKGNIENGQLLQQIESSYFNNQGIMITRLDSLGNIKELPTGDYYLLAVDEKSKKTSKIVFNNIVNAKEDKSGDFQVIIESFKNEVANNAQFEGVTRKDDTSIVTPLSVWLKDSNLRFATSNEDEIKKAIQINGVIAYPSQVGHHFYVQGHQVQVTDIHFPQYENDNLDRTLYGNLGLANQIINFQTEWLTGNIEFQQDNDWQQREISINGIQYIESVKPVIENGEAKEFIYTLTSIQPLTKVTDLMKDYYGYIVAGVFLLTIIMCMYYSKIITKPLLRINDVTKKIINFDFQEKIPVTSKNEIGELSANINELSTRIEAYIDKLKEDIEKEQKLEKTRKDFIAGVSHELKTPLSVLQISVSMLQEGIAPERNEYYWKTIEDEIEKMNVLVNEMLNLAKYESGTYTISLEEVQLHLIIKRVYETLQFQIEDKSLHVRLDVEDVVVYGKENLLEQVMINLLTNAIRYTEQKQHIIVKVIDEGSRVCVTVENKGAHIEEEMLEKIWDQFYRGDVSRHRATGGTGLGLPIVKKILELHHAEYGVTNTNDGVLFYFYLNKVKK